MHGTHVYIMLALRVFSSFYHRGFRLVQTSLSTVPTLLSSNQERIIFSPLIQNNVSLKIPSNDKFLKDTQSVFRSATLHENKDRCS